MSQCHCVLHESHTQRTVTATPDDKAGSSRHTALSVVRNTTAMGERNLGKRCFVSTGRSQGLVNT